VKKNTIKRYSKIAVKTLQRQIFGVDYRHNIRHLTFEVTNLCNSKCEMCHIWANQENPAELTLSQIERIFNDPALKNLEDVIITGGEAFLRNDIAQIVEIIWKINGKTNITLSTNGILAEKILGVAKILFDKNIPVVYGISLDGLGEKHNERRRVKNNFEIIDEVLIPGLKKLSKQNEELVKIGVGHCLDDYGYQTFLDVQKYCKDLNVNFMTQLIEDFDYYLPIKKQNRIKGEWKKIHLHKKGFDGDNRLLKKEIYGNGKNYKEYVATLPPSVHTFRILNVMNGRDSRYECTSMRNFFFLRYDGAVTPCIRFSTQDLGNLHNETLSEVLDSADRVEAVKEILKCDGCLNTWCTEWSMEYNALPFRDEVHKWASRKIAIKIGQHDA
jgi:MoaA/NifB/PqqE/SkfB family radical SAM enzyme